MILSRSGHQNYLGLCSVSTQGEKKRIIYTWAPFLEILKCTTASEKQLLSRKHHAEVERTLRLKVANNMNFYSIRYITSKTLVNFEFPFGYPKYYRDEALKSLI